jgi:glutamine amidotransferase
LIKNNIGIISYKAGNIFSIKNSIEHLGFNAEIIEDNTLLKNYNYLIFPGVGSFGHCVENLKKKNFFLKLKESILKNKIPTLCICVGMQMLGKKSDESNNVNGLNILDFNVKKMKKFKNLKIPHVGWNEVKFTKKFGHFKPNKSYDFYFDHSYIVKNSVNSIGLSTHTENFSSIIRCKNILACQFHPEKSQENGLNFIETFLKEYA